MPWIKAETTSHTRSCPGPWLDLRDLPERIDDTRGGSLIGRQWCRAQLFWAEYLGIKRRLDNGIRLTRAEQARLWQLIGQADEGDHCGEWNDA